MALYIGTSGFSYEEWRGIFYPADLQKEDFLRYYSMFFPFVELDFSYYRMPESWRLEHLADSTPNDFLFSIKAHKSLTHEPEVHWTGAAQNFKNALRSTSFRKRLAGVLLQFPYSFHYTDLNRVYLGELTAELGEFPLFVEFRNAEWSRESVYHEARKRGLSLVAVDAPDLPGLPSRSFPITSESGYLRFHGRNAGNWWTGDNASRYDYAYSDAELAEWKDAILQGEQKTRLMLVAFNNHHKGNAIQDAKRFRILTDENRRRTAFLKAPTQAESPGTKS
jgi:uncharacterized protein YecE (DUF72 family)